MSKFKHVLNEQELADIFESMGYAGGHETFLDIANEVQQAVLAKLAEQEPVAWFTEEHLTDNSATTYDPSVRAMWEYKGWPIKSLYTHPIPCVAPVSDKTACGSENTKYATQTNCQVNLYSSNQEDSQELPPLPEADVYGYRDSYSEELMLEYAKSAIEHHRTTKNHIPDTEETMPEGWQLVPKQPTDSMLACAKYAQQRDQADRNSTAYRAMLAAAPKYTGDSNE